MKDEMLQYYRFISKNAHVLDHDHSALLQLGLCAPDNSIIYKEASEYLSCPIILILIFFTVNEIERLPSLPLLKQWVNKDQNIDPCLLTFTGHSEHVTHLDISPNGKHVLSIGENLVLV